MARARRRSSVRRPRRWPWSSTSVTSTGGWSTPPTTSRSRRRRGAAAAQDFVLGLRDSTVQPSRVEFLNAAALAACEIAGSAAAVAVSIGTAEAAVRAQGDALGALARAAGSAAGLVAAGFWDRYDAAMTPEEGVRLAVGTLASKVGE